MRILQFLPFFPFFEPLNINGLCVPLFSLLLFCGEVGQGYFALADFRLIGGGLFRSKRIRPGGYMIGLRFGLLGDDEFTLKLQ